MAAAARSVLAGEPAWARSRSVGRSLRRGVLDHRLEELVEDRAEPRPGRRAELGDQVVAVDGQVARGRARPPPPAARRRATRSSASPPASGSSAAPDVVGPTQLEQLLERRLADLRDEPADRRIARRPVRTRTCGGGRGGRPARSSPAGSARRREQRLGQLRADRLVADEPAVGERRRLADVVDQGGEPDDRAVDAAPRRRRARCGPRGPRRVTLFWAIPRWAASSGAMPREESRSTRAGAARPRAPERRAASRARRRSARRTGGRRARPGPRSPPAVAGSMREVERGRQADGADHPQRVLAEPRASGRRPSRRIRASEVAPAVVRVDESERLAGSSAPGHRVDREVAPGEVGLDRVAELDPVRSPEVGVVVVGPEGRDLERPVEVGNGDRPEAVLVDGAREQLDDPLRSGVGGEVPVVRRDGRGAGRGASRRPRSRHGPPREAGRWRRGPRPGSVRARRREGVLARQFRPRNR